MTTIAFTGPVNIHEKTRRAMMVPGQNHRDPWFSPFFSKILEDVRMIFGTSQAQTFIYPGTGTGEKVVTLDFQIQNHSRHCKMKLWNRAQVCKMILVSNAREVMLVVTSTR